MTAPNLSFTALLACLTLITIPGATDTTKAFPAAGKGMTRHVLTLPKEENEADRKIELVIGKTVRLEPNNRYFFGGILETRIAEGWGFPYYILPELGPMAGTLMAADPSASKVDRFISLGGEPLLLRYNSKLPLVVYVPDGVEVRYRVWSAPTELTRVPEG
ncbi:MAG: ecotin [Verrucomicrobiia bacterium]